jgi:two-component system nitrogen regulation response regulator NtrX
MGGHLVLALQNSQMHEPLIHTLAAEGTCALCFRSVEEAVAYLREPECPASVAIFQFAMRRQSDHAALTQLMESRPELQLLLVEPEPGPMFELLSSASRPVWILDKPLQHPDSVAVLRRAMKAAAAAAVDAAAEASAIQTGGFLPYSEEFLRRVGMADVPVLLSGETGVGKEVMARRLRAIRCEPTSPFSSSTARAASGTGRERTLWQHQGRIYRRDGRSPGALRDRPGRHHPPRRDRRYGSAPCRPSCCRSCRTEKFSPSAATAPSRSNVRVMAATHRDLTRAIQEGTSARTSITGSTSSRSSFRLCASAAKRFCRWPRPCWPATLPRAKAPDDWRRT